MNLRIPGPIPVPDDILEEMSGPMINHRGPMYKEILFRVTDRLKQVFDTRGDVWILTSSGTGAMSNTQWRKNAVRFKQLDDIAKRLARVEKSQRES